MTTSTAPRSPVLGPAIVAGFVAVAALLFFAIYLAVPGNDHFYSLVGIGILSLVFALAAYLIQSLAPNPEIPRALGWGFAGLGYVLLFGTILLNLGTVLSAVGQILLTAVVLVFLLVTLIGAYWRTRSIASTTSRLAQRETWENRPARSALDYSAASHERDVTTAPTPPSKGAP